MIMYAKDNKENVVYSLNLFDKNPKEMAYFSGHFELAKLKLSKLMMSNYF